jgi:hypothetical protein
MIKIRRMRWTGHVARMGRKRNAYTVLMGKPEERRPLRRLGFRWKNNFKMDLREIGCGGVDWIDPAIMIGTVYGSCEHRALGFHNMMGNS